MKSLCDLPAWKLRELLEKKEISPLDILNSVEERISQVESKIKGYVRIFIDEAKENIKSLPKGRLWGIPIAVKDNICIENKEITCCSKILKGFISPYEATVIKKIKQEGGVIIGITNMDEFAFGSSCETSCYGPTFNPFDLERVPGGSSGGSAAVVRSGESIMALGSDTGGSIRQPASFCGVVGLKPTYGRVSRFGLIAFGSSLDQIGPITRDVKDCALLLSVIAGHDHLDSTSINQPSEDYTRYLEEDIKGMKIGVPQEYFIEGIQEDVLENIQRSISLLKDMGAEVIDISLPHTKYAIPVYYIIAPSEASSNLARFDGVQYGLRGSNRDLLSMYKDTRAQGFGLEAKRRILLGTYCLSSGYYQAYYLRALKVRTLIKNDFMEAFKKVDCILTPTSPTVAFKIGEKTQDPLSMYLSDIFTISCNLAGLPGISIPCGVSEENLPVGVQFIGPPLREDIILKVAYALEKELNLNLIPNI